MKQYIKNERGDITVKTVFVILVINMLIAFLLLFFSVQIDTMNIRSSAKMELNNLSAEITNDTYTSMREGNIPTYVQKLMSNTSYRQALIDKYKRNLTASLNLSNSRYSVKNISLTFSQKNYNKIEYTLTCTVEYYISMFGNDYPTIRKNISITGSHIIKI